MIGIMCDQASVTLTYMFVLHNYSNHDEYLHWLLYTAYDLNETVCSCLW